MNTPKKKISGSGAASRQDDEEFQLRMAEAIRILERNCELIEEASRVLDHWVSIGKKEPRNRDWLPGN